MNAVNESFLPENETRRMAAVRRYDILDTPMHDGTGVATLKLAPR